MKIPQIALIISLVALLILDRDIQTNDRQPHFLYSVLLNGGYGFIDGSGKLVFKTQDEVYNVREYSEGFAVIAVRPLGDSSPEKPGKWGYIDSTSKLAIQPEFESVQSFSEGLAAVKFDGKWGYIDKFGRRITRFDFYSSGDGAEMRFSEELAAVRLFAPSNKHFYGKYGYIDKTGKFAIDPQFDMAFPFSDGMARILIDERIGKGEFGYIDKLGKKIVTPQYSAAGDFSEGLAFVQMSVAGKERIGYIDKMGKMVIPAQFDDTYQRIANAGDLRDFDTYNRNGRERDFSEGFAAVQIDEKWGYINRDGKIVIQPQYRYAGRFSEGLAPVAVRQGRKRVYGFIDKRGKLAIPLQYDVANEFINGMAKVFTLDSHGEIEKLGYIDKTGKYIWKPTK